MILRKIFKKFLILFFKPIKFFLNILLTRLNLYIIWRGGKAIGDQVLMAGLAKALKIKFNYKVIVITNYPSLLSLSPWIFQCISLRKILGWNCFYYILKIFEGRRILEYNFPYKDYGFESQLQAYRLGFYESLNRPPIWQAHVADRLDSSVFENFNGGLNKPNMYKTKKIINSIRASHPKCKIGVINPLGKVTYTKAKAYGFNNYQEIVKLTCEKIKWLQVGLENDLLLKEIHLDLRGENLKFLVDIISFSDFTLSDEGLINHIAGSFPKVKSYVSFSEFSPPKYYSYQNTITLGKPENYKGIKHWQNKENKINNSNLPETIAAEILSIESL